MKITWDPDKNKRLKFERGFGFEPFYDLIIEKKYYEIIQNPTRSNQSLFIISFNNYTYVLPFVIDEDKNIVLKTYYPSRKYHRIYGGKHEKN